MATGDIISAEVLGSTDYNGFVVEITIEGLTAASVVYDAGLDAANNPGASTPYLDLVSEGYDASGSLGTVERRVYLTRILRKAYPDNANLDVTDSSGNAVIRFALSENVYDDDTSVELTMPSGRVSDGTNSNNAATALAVTNSSVLDYPVARGQWDNDGIPGGYRVTDDFTVGFMGRHTMGVACVRLDATGATSAHNQNSTVATQTARLWSGSGLYSNRHAATFPIAGFTQGEAINLRARVYPKIGDADSVFDTDTFSGSEEVLGYTPIALYCDKTEALTLYAYVTTTGDNGTGVVDANPATAEASPFASFFAAIVAGATVVRIKSGTYDFGADRPDVVPSIDFYAEVEADAGASVILQMPDPWRAARANRLKISGCTIQLISAASYIGGNNLYKIWFESCVWDRNGNDLASNASPNDQFVAFYVTNCTGDLGPNYWGVGAFSTRIKTNWWRGNDFVETSGAANGLDNMYSAVGNRQNGQLAIEEGPFASTHPLNTRMLFESNLWLNQNRGGASIMAFGNSSTAGTVGPCVQGNVFEKLANPSAALVICSVDATQAAFNNVLFRHNTVVGERVNFAYNADGSTRYERLHWSIVANSFEEFNVKDDTFGTPSGARTGSWPVSYGVNVRNNHHETNNFDPLFEGLSFTQGDLDWTDDNSATGDASGNGDYTPIAAEDITGRLTADDIFLAVDLFGNPLSVGGNLGAIQFEADVDTDPPAVSSPVGFATGATSATIGLTTDTGEGTVYGALSASATPPSKPDLKAGTGALWSGSAPVDSPGAKTLGASGLAPSTVYFGHLLHTDAAGNDSDIVTTGEIVTSDIEPPESAGPRLPDGPIFMLWPVPGWDCPADHPVLYDPRVVLQGAYQINRLDTAPSNAHVPSWLGEVDIDIPVDATHGQTGRYTAVAAPATEADFRVNGAAAAKKTLLWIRAIHAKYDAPYGRRRPFNIWINNWGYEATNSRVWHRDAADNLLSATPRQDRSPFFASALALWRAFGEEFADTLDALMTPEEKAAPYTSHADLEESMSDRYAIDADSGVGEGFIPLFDADLPSAPHPSDVARWENEVVYFGGVTMRDLWLASRDFVADQWSNNQSFGALSNIAAKGARPDSPPYWFGRTFGQYENMPVRTWWQSLTRLTRGYAWWHAMVEPLQAVLPGLTRTSNWTCARIAPYVHQKVSGLSGLATDFYSRMHANAGFEHGYTHDNYVAYDANAEIASGFTTPDFEALIAEATPEQAALLKRVNGYVYMTSSFAGERRVKPRSLWIREPDPNQVVASSGMPQDMWLAMVRLLHRRNTPDLLIFINASGTDPALRPLTTVANLDRLHAALQALRPASAPSPRERAFRGRGAAIAALAGALS